MPHAPIEPEDDRPGWGHETESPAWAGRSRGFGGRARPLRGADGGRLTLALGAAAVPTVSFGLGLMTVGLHARGPVARGILAAGAGLVVLGLGLLAVAVWRAGGLEPG